MPIQNHACSQKKCSHICLLGPNRSFKCACPENMELFNDFSCEQSKKTENIILGVGKNIVAVPHQTFGRHLTSDAHEVGILVDVMVFNSITGEIFIAESKFGRIISVNIKNQTESILVDQHILSVKEMAFGTFF